MVNFHQLKIVAVIATHGHLDHVLAVKAVKEATGAPFLFTEPDLPMLRNAHIQARFYNWFAEPAPDPDGFLKEGQILTVGKIDFQILELPGHTPGHIALYWSDEKGKGCLFSGDVLFAGSVGRTDLPGGNWEVLQNSLKPLNVLARRDNCLSRHGRKTTISEERRYNPFVPR